jgi:hypothetical protein
MVRSLFAEYVDKYFSRVIGKIVEKFNGKTKETNLLHKTMLTEEYSADLKWGSTEINHSIVAADVVALDSPLPLKKRDTISNATGDLPKIGIKYRKGEKLISDINVAKARNADEATIVSKIFDDTTKCIRSTDVTKEILFRRGLSTGQLLVAEDENDGTGVRVSFGYKDDHIMHCLGTAWLGSAPTPQDDVQQLFDKAEEDGNTISHVYLTKRYFDAFRKSKQGRLLAANSKQQVITDENLLPAVGRAAFLDALEDEYGATFHIVQGSFKIQDPDGSDKPAEAWKEANVVGVPDEIVGRLVYGTLAEETNPVPAVIYQKAGSHVLISKYSKTDPLEEFTAAQALCLPVIDNADGIYVLHADSAGDLTVNPASLSFPKSASTKAVEIHADKDVTVTSNQTWATVEVGSGKVAVSVTANSGAERTAKVTVTDGKASKEVTITQAAGN